MRRVFDLKVFLDPDEDLRREWKTRRDTAERGHAPGQVAQALQARAPDRAAYILPQREAADVVLRLARGPAETLALEVRALNGFDLTGLAERAESLAAAGPLAVEHQPYLDNRWQSLRVSGAVTEEQIRAICEEQVPNLREIAPHPVFAPGVNGLLQAVLLACLSARLRWPAAGAADE
jgi:hypothetical protein